MAAELPQVVTPLVKLHPGLPVPDRAGLGGDPGAVEDRAGQAAQCQRRVLKRLEPAAQGHRRLGLTQRVVDALDLIAQRPGLR